MPTKKVFLHLTVHTVHLGYFSFYIIQLSGDELVKGEQSTLHLCSFDRSVGARSGDTRGDKKFFPVLLFTLFTFAFLLVISC